MGEKKGIENPVVTEDWDLGQHSVHLSKRKLEDEERGSCRGKSPQSEAARRAPGSTRRAHPTFPYRLLQNYADCAS